MDLAVVAADEFADCEEVRCVVVTKADHTAAADRSADARVPVSWMGEDPTLTAQPLATTTIADPGATQTVVTTLTATPNTSQPPQRWLPQPSRTQRQPPSPWGWRRPAFRRACCCLPELSSSWPGSLAERSHDEWRTHD